MITVAIIARTVGDAQKLAAKLQADGQFEVVDLRALNRQGGPPRLPAADVLLVEGVRAADLPFDTSPIVWVSDEPDTEMPSRGGVRASLPRDVTEAELAAALVAVAHDLTVLTESQASRWLRRPSLEEEDGDAEFPIETLTPRELQVLRMLAYGLGNKEVAGRLGISDHTAKFHVAQILAKLRATGRAEAVAIGIRRGLVPI